MIVSVWQVQKRCCMLTVNEIKKPLRGHGWLTTTPCCYLCQQHVDTGSSMAMQIDSNTGASTYLAVCHPSPQASHSWPQAHPYKASTQCHGS